MTGKKKIRYLFILLGLILIFAALWKVSGVELTRHNHQLMSNLIYARMVFSDNESITGYITGLGIEKDGRLFAGGSSCNYVYDKDGQVVGAFNYQRLLYIEIIPEGTALMSGYADEEPPLTSTVDN